MFRRRDPAVFAHPRATWIDPSSGSDLDEHSLMHEMATRQVVLLGETHTVAEIHRSRQAGHRRRFRNVSKARAAGP